MHWFLYSKQPSAFELATHLALTLLTTTQTIHLSTGHSNPKGGTRSVVTNLPDRIKSVLKGFFAQNCILKESFTVKGQSLKLRTNLHTHSNLLRDTHHWHYFHVQILYTKGFQSCVLNIFILGKSYNLENCSGYAFIQNYAMYWRYFSSFSVTRTRNKHNKCEGERQRKLCLSQKVWKSHTDEKRCFTVIVLFFDFRLLQFLPELHFYDCPYSCLLLLNEDFAFLLLKVLPR